MQLRPHARNVAANAIPTPAASLVYALAQASSHSKSGHPESPQRIEAIVKALQAAGLDRHPAVSLLDAARVAKAWPGERARLALELVHPVNYLDRLAAICGGLQADAMVDESTYIAPGSFNESLESAAAVLACLDAVLGAPRSSSSSSSSSGLAGFCVCRPPGHHVLSTRPMGFGLVNLVSAAVAHALHSPSISRVMVVDWDVHHGNGTESIFEASPDVLYLSTHQQGLWPYTGKASFVGLREGAGTTFNVPLPGGAGDEAMALVWEQVVRPAAEAFKPDILIVSAGYDAHWRDPLAALQFTGRTYHRLAAQARQLADDLCGGRCLLILEGGYDLEALGEGVAETFLGLLGGLPPASAATEELLERRLLQTEPMAKVEAAVMEARRRHGLG